jgi:hypothetical protein
MIRATANTSFRCMTALMFAGALAILGCAKRDSSLLPGGSVEADGSVALSPPRMDTSPEATKAVVKENEPLGALEKRLYPPELIMEHQEELAISSPQREVIVKEVQRSQAEMVRLQWELQAEKEKLVNVLDPDHVDERASAEAAGRLMQRENAVKAAHLVMLVRIKNALKPAQIQQLQKFR